MNAKIYRTFVKRGSFVMLCLLGLGLQSATAGERSETPESVMAAARNVLPGAQEALKLNSDLFAYLSKNRSFVTRMLKAAQKQDKEAAGEAIAAALKLSASQVTVDKLEKDYLITLTVKTKKGHTLTICWDTSGEKGCNGKNWSTTVTE